MRYPLFLISCFLFLNLRLSFGQTTLYVSPSGNDANAGTSLATAFKTIQKAANSATPGTTVLVKGGIYHERVIPYTTGTINNEIVIKSYPGEKAIIDAAGTTGWNIFTFYGQAYMRLEGIEFRFNDNAVSAYQSAIGFGKNSNHITIKKCTFTQMKNPNANGIVMWGDDTTANGVHHITIDSCAFGDPTFSLLNGLVINGNVHDVLVSNNIIKHCRTSAILVSGGDSVSKKAIYDYARFITVRENFIDSNYNLTPGSYQSALAIGACRNITIERNFFTHNDMAISISAYKPNTISQYMFVRNNIIAANNQSALTIGAYNYPNGGSVRNVEILNNSLFQNNTLANSYEFTCFPADSILVGNNLIYASNNTDFIYADFKGLTNPTYAFDYNVYASPFAVASAMNFVWDNQYCNSLGYFKSVSGQEMNGDFVLPDLIDESIGNFNLHLYNNSPLIDKGNTAWLTNVGSTDIDGQARISGSGLDVGADENGGDYPHTLLSADNVVEVAIPVLGKLDDRFVFLNDYLSFHIYDATGKLMDEGGCVKRGDLLPVSKSGIFLIRAISPSNNVCTQTIFK